jgi:predicted alpha/beta-fold hydrolase
MRGCGGRPNKLLSWYHSGKSDDLKAVIDNASRRYPELPIVLIGVSVGGNILCKYLGEQAQDVPSRILASVAISAPLDLRGSALCLARWSRRIYMEYLLRPLRARVREKARLFPGLINADGVESITDFYEFDRRYTAPLHGFESVDHYWDTCSGARYLSSVRTPLRLISALDDPFLSPGCFPFQEASRSKWITIETPKRGGHVGFIDSLSISQTWLDRRVCEVVSPLL